MRFLLVLVIVLLGNSNRIFAQWNSLNLGTTQDLYSVDYFSSNDIWIGSFNQVIKTSNAGTNWSIVNPIKDPSNVQILPANMNDLALTSSNTAIAAGLFFMGNNECILTTNNAGVNWTIATNNSTVPLLRYINTVDVFSNKAVAAGNSGRLAVSSNSGGSWTFVNTGTVKMINDVKFISIDTVIAVGDGVILKSVNGGSTWTANTTYTTTLKSVSCKNNTIYIASEYDNTILKSTNYGISYSSISLPFTSKGIICAISKDTLLASGADGLYVSKTGGQYWERYNLSGYKPIKMIDFLIPNVLMAVGDQGYAIKTGNLAAAPTLPICTFSVQGSTFICAGDSVILNNYTPALPGYTYQWKLNGLPFSTQYNSGIKINSAGTFTISLGVTNASGTATSTITINATGHDLNAFVLNASSDTICAGAYLAFTIPVSQSGTSYQLRKGFTNIGASKSGNGALLEYIVAGGTLTAAYNVKATRNNSCFSDSIIQSKNVIVSSNPSPLPNYVPANSYCSLAGITNVTFNSLNNTTDNLYASYFDYSCCRGTTVTMGNTYTLNVATTHPAGEYVKVWIDYNNDGSFNSITELAYSGFGVNVATGTITIDTTIFYNQKLRMRVGSDPNPSAMGDANYYFYCGQVEDYFLIVTNAPTPPVPSFTMSFAQNCSIIATFTNTTYNGNSYTWNFGDGTTSSLAAPTHTFNSVSGIYTVSLTACNSSGCSTITHTLNNVVPLLPIPSVCNTTLTSCGPKPALTMFSSGSPESLGTTNDYMCTKQFHLVKDSMYVFYSYTNGISGNMAIYADLNNDGTFTPGAESLIPYGANYGTGAGYSPVTYVTVPNLGVDSVALRMRVVLGTSFIPDVCSVVCGDYKDFTLFLYPHKLQTMFSVATPTVCAADSITVNFTNNSKGANSYMWHFGDGTTSSQFEPSHKYAINGSYTVKLVTSNGVTTDSLIKTNYIVINQGLPIPTLALNGSVISTTSSATGYEWYKNGTIIPGATSSTYTLTQDGDYTLHLISSNGCHSISPNFSYFPAHINFTLNDYYVVVDSICSNQMLFMSATVSNASTFQINWGDGTIINWNGLGGPIHTYSTTGTYSITLKGCGAFNCDSLIKTIFVNPAQDTAHIVLNSGVFSFTTTANSYQWFESNFPISGATSSTYAPTAYGYYNVKLTNAGGCSSLSGYYNYFPISFSFAADTTAYCGVSNANVQFINTTSNASTYSWDFGDGASSTVQSPSHIYNSPGSYPVKLKACSGSGCDSLIKTNYILINSSPFNLSISASTTGQVCSGDSVVLTSNSSAVLKYQWHALFGGWNPADSLANYSAKYTDDYYAVATNSLGCSVRSNTLSVTIDTDCVWPGDADFSGQANNYDLLPIGIYYNQTGNVRTLMNNNWEGHSASNWGATQGFWGPDLKHVDSNGDGIINNLDTLAITQNYQLSHAKGGTPVDYPVVQNVSQIYLTTSSTNYQAGDWVDIDVNLGSSTTPVSSLYGVVFSVWNSGVNVEPSTMNIIYPNGWLNADGSSLIHIGKIFETPQVVFGALSKINHMCSSGAGLIAKIHFQMPTQLTQSSYMMFDVSDVYGVDSIGNVQFFNLSPALYLTVDPLVTSLHEITSIDNLNIYPNPYSDKTKISYTLNEAEFVQIDVLNTIGQKIKTLQLGNQTPGEYAVEFSASEMGYGAGVYFIKTTIGNKQSVKRIVEIK